MIFVPTSSFHHEYYVYIRIFEGSKYIHALIYMVLNFNIIFSNEVAKYQTQKHLKEKYGRKVIYFDRYVLINKVLVT